MIGQIKGENTGQNQQKCHIFLWVLIGEEFVSKIGNIILYFPKSPTPQIFQILFFIFKLSNATSPNVLGN
jgi:hypothetical protein